MTQRKNFLCFLWFSLSLSLSLHLSRLRRLLTSLMSFWMSCDRWSFTQNATAIFAKQKNANVTENKRTRKSPRKISIFYSFIHPLCLRSILLILLYTAPDAYKLLSFALYASQSVFYMFVFSLQLVLSSFCSCSCSCCHQKFALFFQRRRVLCQTLLLFEFFVLCIRFTYVKIIAEAKKKNDSNTRKPGAGAAKTWAQIFSVKNAVNVL